MLPESAARFAPRSCFIVCQEPSTRDLQDLESYWRKPFSSFFRISSFYCIIYSINSIISFSHIFFSSFQSSFLSLRLVGLVSQLQVSPSVVRNGEDMRGRRFPQVKRHQTTHIRVSLRQPNGINGILAFKSFNSSPHKSHNLLCNRGSHKATWSS